MVRVTGEIATTPAMNARLFTQALLLACAGSLLLTACKKSDGEAAKAAMEEPAVAPEVLASTLPGSAEVLAALQAKDYQTAVAGFLQIHGNVTEATLDTYQDFRRQVMGTLYQDSETSPAAKQAYRELALMQRAQ